MKYENGICYIFGAGERSGCLDTPSEDSLIIAADGGFDYVRELGLQADVVLGDFDSIRSSKYLPPDSIRYPMEKDETDMMLAVKLGLENGYFNFVIYGGLGGRLDHTLANIQVLVYLAHHGASGVLYSDTYAITVIYDSFITFPSSHPANRPGNICSVFAMDDVSVNVSIDGLKYQLSKVNLTNSYPLGVSNEFTGEDVRISVEKGTIVVLWYLPEL